VFETFQQSVPSIFQNLSSIHHLASWPVHTTCWVFERLGTFSAFLNSIVLSESTR
jgi:hypothetical protein